MSRNKLWRRGALVAVGALALVALGGTALAGHLTSGVKSYTGCLVPRDGVIVKVKEGNAPAAPCTAAMTEVHLSGGDITKISVGTGLKLPNGGDDGEVTIELDSKFALRQDCETQEFLKWNGSAWVCSEHRNGTGLTRTEIVTSTSGSTEYALSGEYRVKNNPDCSAGQFASGFDANGTIQCGAPSTTLQGLQARQASFLNGAGVPDDGNYHTMVTLAVPAGTYFVTGKGVLGQGDDDTPTFSVGGGNFGCRLSNLPDEFSQFYGKDNDEDEYGFALAGVVTTTGEAITMQCFAYSDHDQIVLRNGTLAAVKIG